MSLAGRLVAESNGGSPPGITTQDKNVLELWHLTYYFAVPLGLIVIGLILWCVIRYRKRPGGTRKPSQFQYHIPLEVAYTIIPIVIVAVVFGYMFKAEDREDHVAKNPAVEVRVDGFQWGWEFVYKTVQSDSANPHPNFEIIGSVAHENNINSSADLPTLVLPVGETVQFDLFSLDVNHSFYIPSALFKRDLIQGVSNTVDMNFTKTGHFGGECTQFCGTYHPYMRFNVVVEPAATFSAWASSQKPNSISYAGTPSGSAPESGGSGSGNPGGSQ